MMMTRPKQIIPPKSSDMLRMMTERMHKMDHDTLAFVVLWFRLMSDVEHEEAMARAIPLRDQPAMNHLGPTYHAVANLIRSAGCVSQDDLDRILYGVMP